MDHNVFSPYARISPLIVIRTSMPHFTNAWKFAECLFPPLMLVLVRLVTIHLQRSRELYFHRFPIL